MKKLISFLFLAMFMFVTVSVVDARPPRTYKHKMHKPKHKTLKKLHRSNASKKSLNRNMANWSDVCRNTARK